MCGELQTEALLQAERFEGAATAPAARRNAQTLTRVSIARTDS